MIDRLNQFAVRRNLNLHMCFGPAILGNNATFSFFLRDEMGLKKGLTF